MTREVLRAPLSAAKLPPSVPRRCTVCEMADVVGFAVADSKHYWRCRTCGATFMHPGDRLGPTEEQAHYTLHQNRPDDPRYRAFLARLTVHLVPRLIPRSQGLDYGCGPGPTLSVMLREQGFRVADYDPFFAPDRAALERSYEFITCTEVVEHFHRPAREFDRLNALLKPGGWLGIMTRMLDDDDSFIGWSYRRDPTHIVFYKEATFVALAHRHDWYMELPAADIVLFRKPC